MFLKYILLSIKVIKFANGLFTKTSCTIDYSKDHLEFLRKQYI